MWESVQAKTLITHPKAASFLIIIKKISKYCIVHRGYCIKKKGEDLGLNLFTKAAFLSDSLGAGKKWGERARSTP